jgi:hypothetical protein
LFEITKCFSSWSIFDSPQQIKKIVSIQGWGCSHCFLVKRSSLSSLTISWPDEYHHLRKTKTKTAKLHQQSDVVFGYGGTLLQDPSGLISDPSFLELTGRPAKSMPNNSH